MAFTFLKRLFNSEPENVGTLPKMADADQQSAETNGTAQRPNNGMDIAALNNFVTYIVKSLVDQPEQVSLTHVEKGDLTVIQIHCFKKDIGKVIGKSGKTISALRTLVISASSHSGRRVTVDVMDD